MKTFSILVSLFLLICSTYANIIIVDINGGGQYTSINAAIGVANTNDTVKVWPGTYLEQVTLNKNIVLMGSGYENTVLTGSFDPIIKISSGRIQWFQITSLSGTGVHLYGGTVLNCVIRDCAWDGIYSQSGSASVINCVIINNSRAGISAGNGTTWVTNTISRNNGLQGFYGWWGSGYLNVSYSNGSRTYTQGGQGCIDVDPVFASNTDFHISEGSPCWNTGTTALLDPDGSRSDMGYFGGPDCPIYPVVTQIIITPNGNTINLQAKGRANY